MKAHILLVEERDDFRVALLAVKNKYYTSGPSFLSGFVSSLGGSAMIKYGGNMDIGSKVALSAALGGTA